MPDRSRHAPPDHPQHVTTPGQVTSSRTSEPASAQRPASGALGDIWNHLAAAFAGVPALAAEITELRAQMAGARLDRANLAAAALASIAAQDEGEPDPLSYLKDELAAQGFAPEPA